ncbi:MAG TPA: hypothetical protein VFD49_12180 [Candidatus Dormibacteraeota bacterium]|nr:hypothetical protein [Candidatus Dormibacteraeota bacterium]
MQFQHLKVRPPFDDERTRIELMHRLNEIPGVSFGRDVITRRPSIPLSLPANNSAAFEQLKRALEWVEERARGTEEQMTGA